jgi:hypothetical protein
VIGGLARSAAIPLRHRWAHSLPSWRMEVRERAQDIGPPRRARLPASCQPNGLLTSASPAIRMLFDDLVTGGLM